MSKMVLELTLGTIKKSIGRLVIDNEAMRGLAVGYKVLSFRYNQMIRGFYPLQIVYEPKACVVAMHQ